MTNRREFLQIGITATAWPLATSAARAAGAELADAATLPLYKVVYDQRFEASRAFAERARSLGLGLRAIAGDMTRFWYDDLYHEWKKGPAAIAGMTAHGPMFCFEQLGSDQGLRLVFQAKHTPTSGGAVMHALTGPAAMLDESVRLDDGNPQWSRSMAEIVARCPRGRSEIAERTASTPAVGASWDAGDESLYTWVIAPARRQAPSRHV